MKKDNNTGFLIFIDREFTVCSFVTESVVGLPGGYYDAVPIPGVEIF